MNNEALEIKISEEALIQLTIQKGFKGNEFNNKHYIKNGYLKSGSDTHKGFLKKVESFTGSVVRIRKKTKNSNGKVYYILKGLKDSPEGYKDNRGKVKSKLDYELAHLVFNKLLKLDSGLPDHSWLIQLCSLLNLPVVYEEGKNAERLYKFIQHNFNSKIIYNLFENYRKRINRRSIETLKSCLNTLEDEKLIKVSNAYVGVDEQGEEVFFNKEGYDMVKKWLNDMFKKSKFSYSKWYFSMNGENNMKKEEIKKLLLNKHGVTNIYKKYRIELLSKVPLVLENSEAISESEHLKEKYFEKLDQLTLKHQEKQYKKIERMEIIPLFDFGHTPIMKVFTLIYFYNYSYYDILNTRPEILKELNKITSKSTAYYYSREEYKTNIRKALSVNSYGYEKYLNVEKHLDLILEVLKEKEDERFLKNNKFDIDDYYETVENMNNYAAELSSTNTSIAKRDT